MRRVVGSASVVVVFTLGVGVVVRLRARVLAFLLSASAFFATSASSGGVVSSHKLIAAPTSGFKPFVFAYLLSASCTAASFLPLFICFGPLSMVRMGTFRPLGMLRKSKNLGVTGSVPVSSVGATRCSVSGCSVTSLSTTGAAGGGVGVGVTS